VVQELKELILLYHIIINYLNAILDVIHVMIGVMLVS